MAFCADILVPKDRGDTCVMVGAASNTAEETLAVACFEGYRFYVQDPHGPRYPYVIVQVIQTCDTCGGSGIIQGKGRARYRQKPCQACKAKGQPKDAYKSLGQWPIGEPIRLMAE